MKQGYVIAKNSLIAEFFTSTSAYDRPAWKKLNEATVYPTAELADRAIKKLLKNGQYQVRIAALSEMNLSISPIEPMGNRPMGMGDDEELPPEDGDIAAGEDDLDGESDPEGDGADEMKADETEEVCPDCEHEPCTCEDKGDEDDLDDLDGEDLDDIDMDGEDLDGEADPDEITDEEIDALLGGSDDELEQEADPAFDGRRLGMAQLSPMGSPRMESATVPVISYKDKAGDTKDESQFPTPSDDKVRVPSNVMSELKAVIADFDKQAEFSKASDEARASFCMTVADACRNLAADLGKGTVEGVKLANIKLSSYMSPITQHIPSSVIKYVYSGGAKPSLKDLFNAKREEQK
jgi:hypothetical protein